MPEEESLIYDVTVFYDHDHSVYDGIRGSDFSGPFVILISVTGVVTYINADRVTGVTMTPV